MFCVYAIYGFVKLLSLNYVVRICVCDSCQDVLLVFSRFETRYPPWPSSLFRLAEFVTLIGYSPHLVRVVSLTLHLFISVYITFLLYIAHIAVYCVITLSVIILRDILPRIPCILTRLLSRTLHVRTLCLSLGSRLSP
jgi:hypothetical protein